MSGPEVQGVSETAHTPGPWVDNVDGVVVVDKPGRWREIIADVHANPLEANNRRANTRLIAAAPDLLEALVMVRDADDDCRRDGLPTIPYAARKKIDAAIQKARGEKP